MAVQIVSDLGLHLDLQQQYAALRTTGGNSRPLDDVNTLRVNLFWACKTLDTYVETGLPWESCIPVKRLN